MAWSAQWPLPVWTSVTGDFQDLLQELYDAARDRYLVGYQVDKDYDFEGRFDSSSHVETNLVGDFLESKVLVSIEWLTWQALASNRYLCHWLGAGTPPDFTDYLNETYVDASSPGDLPILDWPNLMNYLINDLAVVQETDSSGEPTHLGFIDSAATVEDSRGYVVGGYAIPGHAVKNSHHHFGTFDVNDSSAGEIINSIPGLAVAGEDLPLQDCFLRDLGDRGPGGVRVDSHQYYFDAVRPTVTYHPRPDESPVYPFTVTMIVGGDFLPQVNLDVADEPTSGHQLSVGDLNHPTPYTASIIAADTPAVMEKAGTPTRMVGFSYFFYDEQPFSPRPPYRGWYSFNWDIDQARVWRGQTTDVINAKSSGRVRNTLNGHFNHPQQLVDWMNFWYYVLEQMYVTYSNIPNDGADNLDFAAGDEGSWQRRRLEGIQKSTVAAAETDAEADTPTDSVPGVRSYGEVTYQMNGVGGGDPNPYWGRIELDGNSVPYHTDHDTPTSGITRTLQLYGYVTIGDGDEFIVPSGSGWTEDEWNLVAEETGHTDGVYDWQTVDWSAHPISAFWPATAPATPGAVEGGYKVGGTAKLICGIAQWDFDELG